MKPASTRYGIRIALNDKDLNGRRPKAAPTDGRPGRRHRELQTDSVLILIVETASGSYNVANIITQTRIVAFVKRSAWFAGQRYAQLG